MLRSFRLGNHRSFRDEQELLLMPAYDNERGVVPVAAVYGANASGKSNLLDGLRFMATLVGRWGPREPRPGLGIARAAFRLSPSSLSEPSVFVVELVLDGVRHTYGFTVDDERVREEWLYSHPRGRRRVLFRREGRQIDFGSTVTQRGKAEVVESLLTEETLFLSLSARVELEQFWPVFGWFRSSLLLPALSSQAARGISRRAADFIMRSAADRAAYLELARAADLGITDIDVEELPENRRPRLLLSHGPGGEAFRLGEESDGTQLWLGLLPLLLTCLAEGGTIVIDEIDTSLHPLPVRKLVKLFRTPETNPGHAQLIFTTHDAFLLSPVSGETGLDRDQVWFVEKQPDGASALYPLTDFKPRNEHNVARRYLGGSYGAVPFLDGLDSLDIQAAIAGAES
ncbi:MAG: AAA family ATPase [Egibacteraceae bacterium]